jgi:hypothetical protein
MLVSSGLDVIQEISGPAEEVLKAYIEGTMFQPGFSCPDAGDGSTDAAEKLIRVQGAGGIAYKPGIDAILLL